MALLHAGSLPSALSRLLGVIQATALRELTVHLGQRQGHRVLGMVGTQLTN